MNDASCRGHFRDLSPLSAPGQDERPWIHIVPAAGEYPGTVEIPAGYDVPGHGVIGEDTEVSGLTVITAENLGKMVERFEPEMLIDYEHHSHDPDKRTDAAGWGHALRTAADGKGLEQQTEWAKPARQEITDKVYRYISPEFAGSVKFEDGTYKFFPTRLTGAGLTNRPKLKSLRPVSANRETNNTKTEMKAALTLLCGLIGASESATEQELATKTEAYRAEVATSRNRAKQADDLDAENKKLKAEQIDADLERFKDVIDDKESAKELLQLNRDKTVKLFEGMQVKLGKKPAAKKDEPLFQKNRATAPDGEKHFSEAAEEDEKAVAKFRAVEARAQVISADRKIPFAQAFEAAKAEAGV